LRSVAAPDGTALSYGYNGPLLSGMSWSGTTTGAVSFTYDNNFRLMNETAVGSAISFTYGANGRLTAAGALKLTRDPQNGLLTGSTLGAITDSWTYNAFAEPLTYTSTGAGNPLLSQQFTRNDAGQIVQKNESILGATHTYGYTYDTAGRLTGVATDGATTAIYAYDGNGNRLPGTYDDQDRMLSYSGATYSYTANGELASKTDMSGVTNYAYDELGNLTHASLPKGEAIDYVIDGQNRRVGKKINGALVRQWLYGDQLRIVAELDGGGTLISRFVYGSRANVPDFMIHGGTTYRIISDHLGSPRLIVENTTGSVAQWLDYDAFGIVTNDTNPGFQPFGFAGGLYDPDTQLVRFGQRDYDGRSGRWTNKDPILFFGMSLNLYAYTRSDSINLLDPSGLADLTFSELGFMFR
jgi:RHS repeat-associated protein